MEGLASQIFPVWICRHCLHSQTAWDVVSWPSSTSNCRAGLVSQPWPSKLEKAVTHDKHSHCISSLVDYIKSPHPPCNKFTCLYTPPKWEEMNTC